jgi:AhpD family alkylhydroperoxidase
MKSTKSSKLFAAIVTAELATGLALAAPAHAEPGDAAAQAEADMVKTVGFVPSFAKAFPRGALPGIWQELKDFELNKNTALDGKTRDLIGLAVAAQMPSRLTAWSYSKCGRASGASEAELQEAVMMSAMTRHWSTFFNGIQLDEAKFRAEIGKLRENIVKAMASGAKPPAPVAITDANSVYKDVQQSFGFVPEFMKRFPAEALPGAWLNMRDVEMNPASAIPGKIKSLIGLAVASQIPCKYCVMADTEFAKLEGATDREIAEAVTTAAMARQYITLIEGLQVDEKAYRRDWERLTSGGGQKKTAAAPAARPAARMAKAD